MTYRGTFKNGVVVIENAPPMPDGTPARVEVAEVDAAREPTWGEVLKEVIGKAEGLPSDSSKNHDHHLYGTPKK